MDPYCAELHWTCSQPGDSGVQGCSGTRGHPSEDCGDVTLAWGRKSHCRKDQTDTDSSYGSVIVDELLFFNEILSDQQALDLTNMI